MIYMRYDALDTLHTEALPTPSQKIEQHHGIAPAGDCNQQSAVSDRESFEFLLKIPIQHVKRIPRAGRSPASRRKLTPSGCVVTLGDRHDAFHALAELGLDVE
jgi:hypothetical protein